MNIFGKIFSLFTVLAMMLGMAAACGSSEADTPAPKPDDGVVSISIDGDDLIRMTTGRKVQLSVTADLEGGGSRAIAAADVVWHTSSERVARVVDGMVEAVGAGSAEIIATYAACQATVSVVVAGQEQGDNLSGRVCDTEGRPVEGVVVSDGDLCVLTDADGRYSMQSDKRCGHLFISIPSGYEVECSSYMIPQFFRRLSASVDRHEQHDFTLSAVDNSRFMLIASTDHHVANRQSKDLAQFRWENGFFADVRGVTVAADCPVYSVCMGDMSWDEYWYPRNYDLTDYREELSRNGYPVPIFHAMGNHDNDPYHADDWLSSQLFRETIGPTYYSFNIGAAHFVVLDNIIYRNTGGSQGSIGKLDYTEAVDPAQLAWLERDLALVDDKSAPLVIVMHANLFRGCKKNGAIDHTIGMTGAYELMSRLSGFDDVYVISGHSHINQRILHANSGIHEINVAATSGTWWWTGTYHDAGYDVNVCRDGSPGGYEVFAFDGRNVEWHYKGIGRDRDYMFRAYDMNEVLRNPTIAAASPDFGTAPTADGVEDCYGQNDILVNIWDWEPGWTIRVTEQGRELQGVQVRGRDPMHKIAYTGKTSAFFTCYNNHMWKFRASSATSTVTIEVTDLFGHSSTQVMERPKSFSVEMR